MTALAPMRDITTRAFCDLFLHYGEPDLYVTEFLRVHLSSSIDSNIVAMLTDRRSARPVFVQLLGREPSEFIRIAKLISRYHVHGIDLNFGCPVPKIHRKGVGGALLEEPQTIDKILSELEQSLKLSVSVKIRIGFKNDSIFEKIIDVLAQHNLDHVTIHARTVHDLYREAVNYSYVELAKKMLRCKVFANGDINSSQQACNVAEQTHCDGVMIGRAAVRNPFIFRQISELRMTGRCFMPKLRDLYPYVLRLIDITEKTTSDEKKQVCYMKKYLNFIGQCVDCEGKFLYAARRATNRAELIAAIDFHINERGDEIFHGIPHKNIVARPNCE
ncbi:MAG: tRNA-dihydrouridine synthase family protein [Puniceicoccales bacterium]|jgi:tRNA-dihydrouridine synthase|nr:tRNA-dihydrouridine synthase family protein [Puniceicoccales bacterium]